MPRPDGYRHESHELHRAIATGQTMAADGIKLDDIREYARMTWPMSLRHQASCVIAAKRRLAYAAAERTGQAYLVEDIDLSAFKPAEVLAPEKWLVHRTTGTH